MPTPIAAGTAHRVRPVAAIIFMACAIAGASTTRAQSAGDVQAVAILAFQDESGSGVPSLSGAVTQMLRQRLLATHTDVVPKLVSTGQAGAAPAATPDQLRAIGASANARMVVQGSILRVAAEPSGDRTRVVVVLFADIVTPDTAQTRTVRFDAAVTHGGTGLGVADPAAADPLSAAFAQTPVGQALSDAVAGLADSIYKGLTPLAAVTPAPPPDVPPAPPATVPPLTPPTDPQVAVVQTPPPPPAPPDVPTAQPATAPPVTPPTDPQPVVTQPPPPPPDVPPSPADAIPPPAVSSDFDVQQVIAEAQNAMAAYGGASPPMADQVRVGLEQLNGALAQKADLVSRGQDAQAADQEVARIKDQLRQSTALLIQAQTSVQAGEVSYAPPTAPSAGVMERANSMATQALTLLQTIQQLKAAAAAAGVGGAQTPGQPAVMDPGQTQPEQTVQPPTDVSGVVTQDGQPVGGAEVTETTTGATTTTAPDGTYTLRGVAPGMLGQINVSKQGRPLASGAVQIQSGRPNLADFQLTSGVSGSRMALLGSSTLPTRAVKNAGTLTGTVTDQQGRPVPQAMVSVAGLGVIRTDARGQYMFAGIAPGTYTVSVRDARQGTATLPVKVVAGRTPTVSLMTLMPVAPPATVAPIAATMVVADKSGARVQGRVRDERNTDLAGVRITLLGSADAVAVYTGTGGRFELRDIRPGAYRVVATRPGFQALTRELTLKSGRTESVDFKLAPIPLIVDSRRIAEIAKTPVKITPVSTTPATTEPAKTTPVKTTPVTTTPVKTPQPKPADPTPTIAPRPPLTLVVPRPLSAGRVAGRIVDAKSGKPVPGVTVSVAPRRAVTDNQGAYQIDAVAPGSSQITVSKAGYLTQTRKIAIDGGKTATCDFKLAVALQLKR